jgi:dTDP-N-acetylfucosamine:lipid II N-acetylfucosaminyltransferase
LVNNSASKNGNHATILNKIKIVDKDQTVSKIICPLSYGNPEIVNKTTKLGEILFEDKFNPLLDFLDKDSYFSLIEDVSVAFFGHRRQEAASNISQLLGNGVKVFLRNDNNIMLFMRDKGFLVFSFEDDFNSIEDLNPLTMAQMIQNQNAFLKMVNEKEEYLMMTKIIKS